MINSIQMQQVVKETLERIGLASPEANSFVYHIGLVESKYQYLYQVGGSNIARGLYQCEPWVAVDICKNYLKYRDDLMRDVASACYLDWKYFTAPNEHDWRDILTYNIAAQISMCRLHLRRIPKRLPRNVKEQAQQWKQFYNTAKGKGTVDHFLKIVEAYG